MTAPAALAAAFRNVSDASLRRGLSLLEVAMATALAATLAVVAIPAASPHPDELAAAASILRGDFGFARELAILHNADCTIAFGPDAITLSSTSAAVNAAIAEARPNAHPMVTRLPARIVSAVGSGTSGPTATMTFDHQGSLDQRIDSVVLTLRSGRNRRELTTDFRTGAVTVRDLEPLGGP